MAVADLHSTFTECKAPAVPGQPTTAQYRHIGSGEEHTAPPFPLLLALVESHKARLLGLDAFAQERYEDYLAQTAELAEGRGAELEALFAAVLSREAEALRTTCSFDLTAALLGAFDGAIGEGPALGANHPLPSPEALRLHLALGE